MGGGLFGGAPTARRTGLGLAVLVALGVGLGARAEPAGDLPTFEFRGRRIGEPIERHHPYWGQPFRDRQPYCSRREGGEIECQEMAGKETLREVGGVPIIALHYKYHEGRLFGLLMLFRQNQYDRIKNMVIGRYGEPAPARGAIYGTEWTFREGTLRLQKVANGAFLTFDNPEVGRVIEANRKAAQRAAGRGAF